MKLVCVAANSEVSVKVRNPLFPSRFLETRAMIDTGADFSCVPAHMVARLGFVAYHMIEVGDYDGVRRLKLAYYLTIEFFGTSHELENVVGVEGDTVLLGRDLLENQSLVLMFSSP